MNVKFGLVGTMILGLATMTQAFAVNETSFDITLAKHTQQNLDAVKTDIHNRFLLEMPVGKQITQGMGQVQQSDMPAATVLIVKRTKKRKVAGRPTISSVIDNKKKSSKPAKRHTKNDKKVA